LSRRGKRREYARSAASPVRRIDPKTGLVMSAERSDKSRHEARNSQPLKRTQETAGPPCLRCGCLTEVRQHKAITAKHLAQPFYYAYWHYCINRRCKTTLIMPEEARVYRGSQVVVEEPAPHRDIALEVLDEMNRPPRRTCGDFSRAYREQSARDGTEPECPF
jgi:hypothetical protein